MWRKRDFNAPSKSGRTRDPVFVALGTLTVGDGALVPCRAPWEINGSSDMCGCKLSPEADYRIPVRVNSAMCVDAIQGTAKSKLYRRNYERLTGTLLASEADAGDPDIVVVTAQTVETTKDAKSTK